ncbi:MAG: universal stress protein [Bacteroidia bacterium]|nr:universal stress protein [Bacteroidia bacterium]
MKKILCPTDFSEAADQAVAYSAKLCKKIGAELTLFNVQSIFSLPPAEVIKGKFLATEPISERLEEQCYKVMDIFKIACLSEVKPSNKRLSDSIADRAKDFDLIVMGTNGADDYHQFFFGTNSYQVIRASSVPVLLIPQGCGFQDISTIVFAYDYEHENKLPIEQLTQWAKLIGAKVEVTVLQVKEHYTRDAELRSKAIQESSQIHATTIDVNFDTIYSDEVISSINSYVLRNEADALALCSVNPSIIQTLFHKSVIKELSAIVNYPLFVFHA